MEKEPLGTNQHDQQEKMALNEWVDSTTASSSSHGDENKVRGNWSKQIEFTLSCIGYSVGLGNLWRFPYLCMRNGGGAFLIPYFTFLFVCGLPMFFMELVLGQFSSLSPTTVWRLCPMFKGIGWASIIVSYICLVYYNIILTWTLYFLGNSFARDVPWKTCDNSWNTETCLDLLSDNSTFVSEPLHNDPEGNVTNLIGSNRTAAEEYFLFNVLGISEGIEQVGKVKWDLLLCLLAACTIIFLCLCKGIKSSGKVIYVTATVPYVFLTILFIRGITLPGSLDGIKFYIIPEWSRLLEFKVWREACLQIFYSLGPSWGGLITMSSYNRFHNNCLKDAVIVCVTCSGTSFYAGFVIFSVIGFMAHEAGVGVDKVISAGPGLAFVAYPEAIARLPLSPFWAVCFFLMLLTLGLDSQFTMMESICSCVIDEFPKYLRKKKMLVVLVTSFTTFVLGIPLTTRAGMYIFHILDWYCAAFSVVLIGFLECIIVSYVYGIGQFYRDATLMLRGRPSVVWAICWCAIVPALLLMMLVVSAVEMTSPTYGDYIYPQWAEVMGWVSAMISIAAIPVVVVYTVVRAEGSLWQRITTLLQPASDWGPSLEKYCTRYDQTVMGRNWRQRMSMKALVMDDIMFQDDSETIPEKKILNSPI